MEDLFDLTGKGFVSIWVGNFASMKEFEEYMAEKIGDDDDVSNPINRFAADIGFGFYDHDFQEAEFFGEKLPVKQLLSPFSYSESFLEKAVQAADDLSIEAANTAILLFDYDYKENKMNESAQIEFLGSFGFSE